jgi:hypothetical protein
VSGIIRRTALVPLLVPLLVVLAACQKRSAIWLVGQEEAGRPVFGVGETFRGRPTWLGLMIVAPCKGWDGTARNAVWFLAQEGNEQRLSRVVYGRVPPGYVATRYMSEEKSTAVSPPLRPGCYIASISGTGRVRFSISPDGSALELGDDASVRSGVDATAHL